MKQFVALSNVTLGKTPYEVLGREKQKVALIRKGEVFRADEKAVEKLLKLKKIKETTDGPAEATLPAVEESARRGRR